MAGSAHRRPGLPCPAGLTAQQPQPAPPRQTEGTDQFNPNTPISISVSGQLAGPVFCSIRARVSKQKTPSTGLMTSCCPAAAWLGLISVLRVLINWRPARDANVVTLVSTVRQSGGEMKQLSGKLSLGPDNTVIRCVGWQLFSSQHIYISLAGSTELRLILLSLNICLARLPARAEAE